MELVFRLKILGKLPSWNAILSVQHWKRSEMKKAIQKDFISALSLSENAESIPTMLALSGSSTLSDLLARFEMTRQKTSRLKSPKGSAPKAKKSTRS